MDNLYSWTAKRSGPAITIKHSCGGVSGVTGITTDRFGRVIAEHPTYGDLQLSTAPHQDAETDRVNPGVSDLFFNNEQACEAYRDAEMGAGDDEPSEAMNEAAKGFQYMLRAAGLVPPTVAALWADFLGRV